MTAPPVRPVAHRCRGDSGSTAVELPMAAGLLLIPIIALVLVVPQWPEARSVANSAAKEAASLYATAETADNGVSAAETAVSQTEDNYGRDLQLTLSGQWCRGCTVTATVSTTVPAVRVPTLGSIGSFTYTATSTARVEDYGSM